MKTQSFKDLIVWQKAHKETVDIYQTFNDMKDFGFRDQIQRASVSVMNNIAEGYARRSDKAFIHFLRIAKGSNTEVESMLILAGSLQYISTDTQKRLLMGNEEIGKLLSGFINKLSAEDY
mgnify:CR=1 FL=1